MTKSWTIVEYNQWINNGMPINENITNLDLYNNQLTTLPESIGNLTQLITICLYDNYLTTLPESIGNLTLLTHLNLSNNKLTTLPKSFGKSTAIIGNITQLYQSLEFLTELKTELKNNFKLIKDKHKLYFNNYIFEE